MKIPLTGFICTCLLVIAGNPPGRAQEKKPGPQPAEQVAPVTDASQQQAVPADPTPPDEQTPPPQTATPPQTPPAGQTPPAAQTPPAGQTPPAAQTPPPAEDQPTQHGIMPQPPPPPPKVPDVRRPGESGFWIGIEGWIPKEQPFINGGNKSTVAGSSTFITLQGKPKAAERLEVGAAVGLHNTLKLNYTDMRASGDFTTPVDVTAWAQTYTAGTYVSTNYHVQNFNLSYEYLTWPYPVGSRKVRLKTLWQVQFTNISSEFDSPLDYYDSNGNLRLDASGNPVNLSAGRSKHIISPLFGLGLSYYPSRHFRFEASGAGFGLPHRWETWNADASINLRVTNHFEIGAGARGYGFKTSTNADYYLKGNYLSAFVGVRWYSNSE